MEIRKDQVIVGLPINEHLALLKHNGLMPMEELLGQHKRSLLYNETTRDNRLYAQAWLAVHQLFFSPAENRANAVTTYLNEIRQGTPPAVAFKTAFGLSSGEMDQRTVAYLSAGRYPVRGMKFQREKIEGGFRQSLAEPWEVMLAQGTAAHMFAHNEVAGQLLSQVRDAHPEDSRVHFWLGDIALIQKKHAEALRCFDAAIERGADHSSVYYWHAVATLRAQRPDDRIQGLDQSVLRALADDLSRAIRRSPWEQPAYDLLVRVLPHLQMPTEEDTLLLSEALKRWPKSGEYLYVMAALDEKAGRTKEAYAHLQEIAELDPPASSQLRELVARQLQARAATQQQEELQVLFARRDYANLREKVNQILRTAPAVDRDRWRRFREQVRLHENLERAEELLSKGQRDEAAGLLDEIVAAPTVDLTLKSRARTLLQNNKP